MTENEIVGWHHQWDGHQFEQALGVGDGQGSLVCCSPWDHKELDNTELLNSNNLLTEHFTTSNQTKIILLKEKRKMDISFGKQPSLP